MTGHTPWSEIKHKETELERRIHAIYDALRWLERGDSKVTIAILRGQLEDTKFKDYLDEDYREPRKDT